MTKKKKRLRPAFESDRYKLYTGDSRSVLKRLPAEFASSVVTDPPYELGFMGKGWDKTGVANDVELWRDAYRALKPGGYLLAFSGSRTYHRMVCAIEDAGFEIRDQIMWLYGSGFPKSMDVSKAIDKAAGAEREVFGRRTDGRYANPMAVSGRASGIMGDVVERVAPEITAPATEAARQWSGWGTALKPAHEPICVARKPLVGTVAANVLEHGTGALNIDACRVEHVTVDGGNLALNPHLRSHINGGNGGHIIASEEERRVVTPHAAGRWPANVIHDGSPDVLAQFPTSKGSGPARTLKRGTRKDSGWGMQDAEDQLRDAGSGSAARFFYCAKASKSDRNAGVGGNPESLLKHGASMRKQEEADWKTRNGNPHPTVKPTELMRYLVRMITPPNGIVLDPFMGSGSTGRGCALEGVRFVGIDLSAEYTEIARARIDNALTHSPESKARRSSK